MLNYSVIYSFTKGHLTLGKGPGYAHNLPPAVLPVLPHSGRQDPV